jgi:hypothetical protein
MDATAWVSNDFLAWRHIDERLFSRFVLLVPCVLADRLGHKHIEQVLDREWEGSELV